MTQPHDPLLDQLRALPPLDTDEPKAELIRRMASAELSRNASSSTVARRWSALWNSVLEPVLVAVVILVYAGWGWSTTASLFRQPQVEPAVATLASYARLAETVILVTVP